MQEVNTQNIKHELDTLLSSDIDLVEYIETNHNELEKVINYLKNDEKSELLVYFLSKSDLNRVKLLVESGADISYNDYFAFLYAAHLGDLDALSYFVSKGADIRTVSDDGDLNDSIIFIAAQAGKVEVLKYAKSLGIDLHAREDLAFTLAAYCGHLHVLEYLYNEGADVRARDDEAIFNAYKTEHTDCYNFLVSKGAILPEDVDCFF